MKPVTSKSKLANNGTSPNGTARLPKAPDFKLPKKLSDSQKERIEVSRKFFDAVREAYKNEQKTNR